MGLLLLLWSLLFLVAHLLLLQSIPLPSLILCNLFVITLTFPSSPSHAASIYNALLPRSLRFSSSHVRTTAISFLGVFLGVSSPFTVPLIRSFPVVPNHIIPVFHLSICITATSNFFPCAVFFIGHASGPHVCRCQQTNKSILDD